MITDLIQKIDNILPQTQCTKCGYDGCLPYANALAANTTSINRCPPGGEAGIIRLAALLHQTVIPLDSECGNHSPLQVAVIDEKHCIGCTLCIQACPVDAIIGANKFMHTVVDLLCSGCDLCVPVCPVDCISIHAAQREWKQDDADAARARHQQRAQRLARLKQLAVKTKQNITQSKEDGIDPRQQAIANALARARARRAQVTNK